MKCFTSLLSALALLFTTSLALPQGSGPTQYRVDNINALLQITLFGADAKVTAWVGGASARDDGLGGMFFYDGTSSAATNVYAVFKPVNNNGRWWKLPTAVAYQTAAVTVATDTTYAWKLLRGAGATNFLGFGADNNIAYIQTFNGKNLHINNQGNHTILNSTAGSVGIGSGSPNLGAYGAGSTVASIQGSVKGVLELISSAADAAGVTAGQIDFDASANTSGTAIARISSQTLGATAANRGGTLLFQTKENGTGVYNTGLSIDNLGNVGMGTSTFGTSADTVLGIFNGTAPSTSPADAVQLYSADVTAGNAALHIRGEDGSIASIGDGGLLFTGAQSVSTTTGALTLSTGAAAGNIALNPHTTGSVTTTGDIELSVAGKGIEIKEGSNARMGTATLSGGTIAVSNTSAATGDRIFIQRVSGTAAEFGHLSYTISNGVSFTINSTDAQDDSVVNWLIIKPTP